MRKYRLSFFTDQKLLSHFVEWDDIEAFEEIYNRYWRKLLDIAFQRVHSKEIAQEIVQEVMVSLYLRRQAIPKTVNLEAWLRTAIKYKVFNNYRSQQVHLTHLEEIILQNQISPLRPDESLVLKETRERVTIAAARLPEKCRQVFMMSRFEQLSQQEIADRLDISVSTVKKHLTRALTTLKEDLREDHSNLLGIALIFIFIAFC